MLLRHIENTFSRLINQEYKGLAEEVR